jgi:hypothetical protein
VELTTFQASNPDENVPFSKLILEKLSLAAEQLGMVRVEDSASEVGSDINLLSTW